MASQFVQFSSSDASGPGLLTGQAGDLLRVLDLCLVTTYSGHVLPTPWTKPFANSGNIGCYKQPAGAGLNLLINDNGPNVTSTFKEAWATGWETLAGIGAPVGTGTGQFPTPAQLLTSGHTVIRKSASADTVGRQWLLFADATTFYLFLANGDTAGSYSAFFFGDIYSLKGASDLYRCMIYGRLVENTAATGGSGTDGTDLVSSITSLTEKGWLARGFGGFGGSIQFNKIGDMGKVSAGGVSPMIGAVPSPNGPDNSWYISPVGVGETVGATFRGRMRGMFHICHSATNFSDGQTIQGSNDFAGKAFQLIKLGFSGGVFCIETSNTVETN